MADPKKSTVQDVVNAAFGYGIIAIVFVNCVFCDDDEPKPKPKKPVVCMLTPLAPDIPKVVLFPTEEGMDAYTKAAVNKNSHGMALMEIEHRAFTVDRGTPCGFLDRSWGKTRVSVSAGPHVGKTGWTNYEATTVNRGK